MDDRSNRSYVPCSVMPIPSPPIQLIRHSSVAYLASFLARAPFVEASTVSEALRHMLEWADDYLGKQAEALTWTKVKESLEESRWQE